MDPEKIATFQSIAGCDAEFATSFLEASSWNLELAVQNFMGNAEGPMSMSGASGGGGANPGDRGAMPNPAADGFGGFADFQEEEPRAAMPQFRDTLIDVDPAQRMPRRQPSVASNHPLEAFRDFRRESAGASADGSGVSAEEDKSEVFGLSKRPKNLAEIYKAPTELCFLGSFEELRAAGRAQQRWLLVNIQSPTEFASQQLNADTWHDETLQAVIKASFLFWQQYYDSPDGQTFCRFYLPRAIGEAPEGLPHIGIVDPITGQCVKTWTGFKDPERLMDKLMDLADSPPVDPEAMIAEALAQQAQAEGSAPSPLRSAAATAEVGRTAGGAGGDDDSEELAAAIAASLEASGSSGGPLPVAAPPPPTDAEVDAIWGEAAAEPADGMQMRVRLPDGQTITRRFGPTQTLREVLVAIHTSGRYRLDPSKTYGLTTFGSAPVTGAECSLQSLGVTRGAYNLTEC